MMKLAWSPRGCTGFLAQVWSHNQKQFVLVLLMKLPLRLLSCAQDWELDAAGPLCRRSTDLGSKLCLQCQTPTARPCHNLTIWQVHCSLGCDWLTVIKFITHVAHVLHSPKWLLGLQCFISKRRFRICSLQHRYGVTCGLKVASPLRQLKWSKIQRPRGGRTQLRRCLCSLTEVYLDTTCVSRWAPICLVGTLIL